MPVYLSGVSGATLDERIDDARRCATRGFRAIKLFLGQSLAADVAEVAAMRDALGKDVALMVDVQWRYDVPDAIRLGRALERFDVTWLETPSNPEDIAGHAAICAALDLPIASGECERTSFQFHPWLERRALDIAQPDVGRAGGLTESRKIAALAETYNVPCALHLGVGLAPYIAASVQARRCDSKSVVCRVSTGDAGLGKRDGRAAVRRREWAFGCARPAGVRHYAKTRCAGALCCRDAARGECELTGNFDGVFPILATIFDDAGDLDERGQRRVIDFLIDAGVNGL